MYKNTEPTIVRVVYIPAHSHAHKLKEQDSVGLLWILRYSGKLSFMPLAAIARLFLIFIGVLYRQITA